VVALGVTTETAAGGGGGWLGVVGAIGIVASAAVAKVWPIDGVLHSLGSRDGFYAMLLLFIGARAAAPGALPALMVVIALGAHAYWIARGAYTFARP
jgi:hypothetical protein